MQARVANKEESPRLVDKGILGKINLADADRYQRELKEAFDQSKA